MNKHSLENETHGFFQFPEVVLQLQKTMHKNGSVFPGVYGAKIIVGFNAGRRHIRVHTTVIIAYSIVHAKKLEDGKLVKVWYNTAI